MNAMMIWVRADALRAAISGAAIILAVLCLVAIPSCSCRYSAGEFEAKETELATAQGELAAKDAALTVEQGKVAAKDADLTAKTAELNAKVTELADKDDELNAKSAELTAKVTEIGSLKDEVLRLTKAEAGLGGELKAISDAKVAAEAKTKEAQDELLKVQQEVVKMKGEAEAKAEAQRQAQLEEERRNGGVAAFRKWASGCSAMKAALIRYVIANAGDDDDGNEVMADAMPSVVELLFDKAVGKMAQDAITQLGAKCVQYVANEVGGYSYHGKPDFAQAGVVAIGENAIPELLEVAKKADKARNGYLRDWAIRCMALIYNRNFGVAMLKNYADAKGTDLSPYAAGAIAYADALKSTVAKPKGPSKNQLLLEATQEAAGQAGKSATASASSAKEAGKFAEVAGAAADKAKASETAATGSAKEAGKFAEVAGAAADKAKASETAAAGSVDKAEAATTPAPAEVRSVVKSSTNNVSACCRPATRRN